MTRLLQEWVMRQADVRPEGTALVMRGERLTYGQLDALSNQVAHALRAAGCRRGDRVGLLLRKSPTTIASLLGVLKADACYVPLDTASPSPRLAKIVAAAAPRVILTTPGAGVLEYDALEPSVRIGWMDVDRSAAPPATAFTLTDVRHMRTDPPTFANGPADLAQLLFTSGSTGDPKGVMITHASVVHFVEWARVYFGLSATDRLSGHSPLHFDLSTFDLFGTFSSGAQLHLVPPELNVVPHKLVQFMRESELTQWFSVPSVLALMAQLDVVRRGDVPTLRRMLWCGEVFPTPALRYWMQRLPDVPFTNLYGPTEATIASSYYTVPRCPVDDHEPIPIGRPCAGEELLVLDESLQPVAPGETGDLYIRGAGLSRGYWRDPEKTAAAFRPNPADPRDRLYRTGDLARVGDDGLLYFLGRADSQIKSRGYRIELGEIEVALQSLPGLAESAIVARSTEGFEGTVICCAYVPRPGAEVTPLTLRQQVGALLPAYMLPSQWKAFSGRLPRNANGKIDRRRIRDEWTRGDVPVEA
jgi:amino acid adenylation domain-containing protein